MTTKPQTVAEVLFNAIADTMAQRDPSWVILNLKDAKELLVIVRRAIAMAEKEEGK